MSPYIAKSKSEPYPINRLRNIGIQAVETRFFIMLDIDFWPDTSLHETLNRFASSMGKHTDGSSGGRKTKRALIVPAFRTTWLNQSCRVAEQCPDDFDAAVPNSFPQLVRCVSANFCRIFDWVHNANGHSTTDYPLWFMQNESRLRKVTCFRSDRYEPYVLLENAPDMMLYDESFTGYGKNKIQHIMHLRSQNYEFFVVPRSFIVHVSHTPSKVKKEWIRHDFHRQRMEERFRNFKDALSEASNYTHLKTGLCTMDWKTLTRKRHKKRDSTFYTDMWMSTGIAARKVAVKLKYANALIGDERYHYREDILKPPCERADFIKSPSCY
eukprot:CAMPEP_0185754810 /NCGR_PEP_ID=MMETSP1174-20130828/13402_1 /TAXON_ID=35687 /ORGANISM="Dictyocha speculum, Strain CCMP1381" /LENGTH=325 /DNA_ID=CAMNT_0028433167 /DNA_START=399 /DNA_END=1376 /DNA_ORIENTATION=+